MSKTGGQNRRCDGRKLVRCRRPREDDQGRGSDKGKLLYLRAPVPGGLGQGAMNKGQNNMNCGALKQMGVMNG
ncbi:MAG: hypothetical protein ISS35_04785 [Kiritimatiellae bacterium]|nr:hypothetical protein [Kiritimatiellia bacterium]